MDKDKKQTTNKDRRTKDRHGYIQRQRGEDKEKTERERERERERKKKKRERERGIHIYGLMKGKQCEDAGNILRCGTPDSDREATVAKFTLRIPTTAPPIEWSAQFPVSHFRSLCTLRGNGGEGREGKGKEKGG